MKIRKSLTSLLSLTLLLSPLNVVLAEGSIDTDTTKNEINKNIEINIDSSITGNEREVIADVMARLDEEDRENVIYVTEDGAIYSNKIELKATTEIYDLVDNNTYQSPTGKELVGPGIPTDAFSVPPVSDNTLISPTAESPSPIGGSGPYRRVFSNNGYNWLSTYVTIPGAPYVTGKVTTDTPYVYLGGWGSNGNGIDAGLQYSTAFDNWAPTTLANGSMVPSNTRYRSGQDIYMKFYVTNPNECTLAVSGITTSGDQLTTTIVRSGVSGWDKSGTGMRVKRMTTIGQKPENMNTGSYIKNVRWHDITLGYYSGSNLIYSSWGSGQTGGYHSVPADKVSVNYISPGEETVNIQL
ncbi:YrpD family protein [Paenibacillus xylanivorans]|uniref:Uncharacterized protein n=1 Tax=Paenibacillus xylanivorans TaxID=1705561 RepID=A0A0M9BR03_9BACL|nr:YrpD family protein [Paenibacillus xylanivorans]KOY17049.1 hypothetical protein AMS66_09400 [Paenibacillus xylanivorans]